MSLAHFLFTKKLLFRQEKSYSRQLIMLIYNRLRKSKKDYLYWNYMIKCQEIPPVTFIHNTDLYPYYPHFESTFSKLFRMGYLRKVSYLSDIIHVNLIL